MTQSNKERILQISRELDLSHIGSNLSELELLEEIYEKKNPDDIVILDNSHAHLAHLVVRYPETVESMLHDGKDYMSESIELHGIHCDRQAGCDASGGSLGHGLGIAIGYALADPYRMVYVTVSEGSMMEGSSWEALRLIRDLKIDNIEIHCNFNGFSAVAEVGSTKFMPMMKAFLLNSKQLIFHFTKNGEGYEGVQGHYIKAL